MISLVYISQVFVENGLHHWCYQAGHLYSRVFSCGASLVVGAVQQVNGN